MRPARDRVALDISQAGERLDHRVIDALLRIGAGFAEAAYRDVNEVGLDRPQRGLADSHPIDHARAEVLHEQVGLADQALQQLDAFCFAQIEH